MGVSLKTNGPIMNKIKFIDKMEREIIGLNEEEARKLIVQRMEEYGLKEPNEHPIALQPSL